MKSLLSLLTVVSLVSCQTNGDDAPDEKSQAATPSPAAPEPAMEFDITNTDSLIGKPLEKVEAACDAAEVPHRVIELDGEPRPVTMDYRLERLNFKVRDGLIIAVTKG